MAFTDLGSLGSIGSTNNNQTTLDLVTAAAIAAGDLVVVVVAADNIANGGDDNAVSGLTLGIGGQALLKGKQIANALAAQAGASSSIWYGIATSGLASGGTIRATFGSASLVDASGMTARKFSVASGNGVALEGTAGTLVGNTAADPGSLNVTTANIACLRIRGIASQVGNNTNLTPTSTWTAWANGNSATTGTTAEMCARAEHRISTATGAASDPTYVSAIYASCYVALKEVPPVSGNGDADGIAGATGDGGAIKTTPGTAGGVAAATAVGEAASIYSAEADQFFARTTGLTSERKALLNTYINALVAGGVWAKLQVHYLFAAPDAATAVINLKSSSFPGTINGSPTFAADAGFTNPTIGTTTHYIDTGYNPSVHGAQNDQHISAWNSTNQVQDAIIIGCAPSLFIYPKWTDNNAYHRVNCAGSRFFAVGDPRGLHLATTAGTSSQEVYFNGTSQSAGSTTVTPPNANIYVLAINESGTPQGGTFQARSASLGTELTAGEVSAFFDAQYAFLAALVGNIYSSEGSATGVAAAAAQGGKIASAASAGGGGDWTTVVEPADTRQVSAGWVGYTIVGVIPLANFSETGGTQARITFQAPWGGEGAEYSAFYIGNGGGGDPYDFGDTPVQVTVSGSGTISVPVNAALGVVVSDAIAFTKDASNSLVFAAQFINASADNVVYFSDTGTGSTYYKGATEAALQNKTGYSGIAAGAPLVFKIELFSGGAAGVAGVGGALAVGAIGVPAAEGAGSAIGIGAAAASAAAITTGASSAPGVGTAAATGGKIATTSGAAPGVGTAAADGRQIVTRTATAAGIGAASAEGAAGSAQVSATGSAAGIGTAAATGAKIAATSSAVAGVGTAAGVSSAAAFASGVGSAAGVGTAAATGGKTAAAQGAASGLGIASGSSSAAAYVSGVGTAAGIGTAAAVGFATSAAAVGTAAGLGAAAATGQRIATAIGAVVGTGAAAATSGVIGATGGSASGIGAAAATGFEAAVVFNEAAGSANGVGTTSGIGFAIQPSATPGDRVTEIPFVPRGGSVPASMRGAAVAGSRRIAAVAGHNRIAIVPRRDRAA